MYSSDKLNKQGYNIQPWCTPFPIWNQSVVPCPVPTVASWAAYRFLKRQVRWSGIPISKNFPQFVVIHIAKGFGIVNKADVFMELSCFFDDPTDVGNFISGSSAISKSNLNIGSSWFTYCWKLAWRILSITLLACEMSEHSSALPFFGIGMKTALFQSCGYCYIFQICWHVECSTFTASSFRIWKSSTGIPSLSLALFLVMLPKAHLTSHFRMSALGWWSHHRDYLDHEDLFCIVLLCILASSS